MIDFWPKAIFSQRFPPKISSLQATSKNTVSQNCYLLSVICNAKNSFLETVILSNCNAWCELALSKKQEQSARNLFFLFKNCNTVSCKNYKSWCQWPVTVTSEKISQKWVIYLAFMEKNYKNLHFFSMIWLILK